MEGNTDRFKIFVSHSHEDREIAGTIKETLEARFTISVFVAHEDISPTEDWQDKILAEIKGCDAFVALLSQNFKNSKWTDQETGIALALGKLIISVRIDLDPYGFVNKYQAMRWKTEDPNESKLELINVLYEKLFEKRSTNDLIKSFVHSASFDDAGVQVSISVKSQVYKGADQ